MILFSFVDFKINTSIDTGKTKTVSAITIDANMYLTLYILDTGKQNIWANSEEPNEMPHNAAFHQDLHYLQR